MQKQVAEFVGNSEPLSAAARLYVDTDYPSSAIAKSETRFRPFKSMASNFGTKCFGELLNMNGRIRNLMFPDYPARLVTRFVAQTVASLCICEIH